MLISFDEPTNRLCTRVHHTSSTRTGRNHRVLHRWLLIHPGPVSSVCFSPSVPLSAGKRSVRQGIYSRPSIRDLNEARLQSLYRRTTRPMNVHSLHFASLIGSNGAPPTMAVVTMRITRRVLHRMDMFVRCTEMKTTRNMMKTSNPERERTLRFENGEQHR